jgi:hypothetical protein
VEGLQRGITHWHKDASRSTGGICKDHAFELHKKDPNGFRLAYRMRHGRACERCGILRRATHGYLGEGVSRFCGECAGAQRGCVDLNNFKCKIQSCNRMARFIGAERDRLVFRCWAHKAPDMKEAGDGWRGFYADFCARAASNGAPPLLDQDPATGQLLAVPMALPPPPPPMPLPGQHNPLMGGAPALPLPVPVPLTALSGDAEGLAIDRAGGSFAAPSPTGSSGNGPAAASSAAAASGNAKRQRKAISPMAPRSGGKRKAGAESEESEAEESEAEESEDEVEMSDQEEEQANGQGESKEGVKAEAGEGEGQGQGQQQQLQQQQQQQQQEEEVPPPASDGALPHPPTESLNI